MSEIPSVGEQRSQNARETRATTTCPICSGTVREPRSGDVWLCDGCARQWTAAELGQ